MSKILVIDDQYGTSVAMREGFLSKVGAVKILRGQPPQPVESYPYTFDFCPAQTRSGEKVVNSVEAVLQKVRECWLSFGEHEDEAPRWAATDGSHWALVLLDVQFDQNPSGDDDANFGFVLLNALRREFGPDLPIVMMTQNTDETRRRMANYGEADGFLSKDQLTRENLDQRLATLGLMVDERPEGVRLIGRSLELLKVLREARRFALNPRGSRIIYGETGSGKTALASYIAHHCGRGGRLVTWMAQPAQDELNRDQLFGHWAGAFTGAETSEPGAIERAHGGVFLLDEVADLTPAAQQLLLEFRRRDEQGMRRLTRLGNFPTQARVGRFDATAQARQSIRGVPFDNQGQEIRLPQRQPAPATVDYIKVDVVLLFATNRPLWDKGFRHDKIGFREDLYVELGSKIDFPSLNRRREDVGPLFKHFLARFLPAHTPTVSPEVIGLLEGRNWTHRNVADLIRIAEYTAFSFGSDFQEVLIHHLPPDVREATESKHPSALAAEPAVLPTAPPAHGPSPELALRTTIPFLEDTRCALALNESTRLRERVQLLARALEETAQRDEATGNLRDYSPKRACDRLYGINVPTTEAKRLVAEIIGAVLEPKDSYERALAPRGLLQCQDEIKNNILLVLWYQWACDVDGFTDNEVNWRLREFFEASKKEPARGEELRKKYCEGLETEVKVRLEKRRKGKQRKAAVVGTQTDGDTE